MTNHTSLNSTSNEEEAERYCPLAEELTGRRLLCKNLPPTFNNGQICSTDCPQSQRA